MRLLDGDGLKLDSSDRENRAAPTELPPLPTPEHQIDRLVGHPAAVLEPITDTEGVELRPTPTGHKRQLEPTITQIV